MSETAASRRTGSWMPLAGSALLVLFLLTLVVLANVDNEQPVRQPAPTPTPTSSLPTQ